MKNIYIDFESLKIQKHFNPIFQLCFKALPSKVSIQQQRHSNTKKQSIKSQQKHKQPFIYILITKPVSISLPQTIFQCKSLCPIFNYKSQSYILVKGQNLWDYYKSKKSIIFTEEEIWIFMKQILKALLKLVQIGIYHNHLKQYAVYRQGPYSYQLVYHPEMKSMLQLTYSNQYYWYDFYLSPQELSININKNSLSHSHSKKQFNQLYERTQKDTIFSLGLMVLNMMNLQSFNKDFYDKQKVCIDWVVVRGKLQTARGKYSQRLVDLVESCLRQSFIQRSTLYQVYLQIVNNQKQMVLINDKFKLKTDQLLNKLSRYKPFSLNSSYDNNKKQSPTNKNLKISQSKENKQNKKIGKLSKQSLNDKNNYSNSSGKKTQSSPKSSIVNNIKNNIKECLPEKKQNIHEVKKWSMSSQSNQRPYSIAREPNQSMNKKKNESFIDNRGQLIESRKLVVQQRTSNNINQQQKMRNSINQEIINFERGTFGGEQSQILANKKSVHNNRDKGKQRDICLTKNHIKIETSQQRLNNDDYESEGYNDDKGIGQLVMMTNDDNLSIGIENDNKNDNDNGDKCYYGSKGQQEQGFFKNNNKKGLLQQIILKQEQKQFQKQKLVTFGSYVYLQTQEKTAIANNNNQLQTLPSYINNSKQENYNKNMQENKSMQIQQSQPTMTLSQNQNRIKNQKSSPSQLHHYHQQQQLQQNNKFQINKLITVQDLKLKQLNFIDAQKKILSIKTIINNRLKQSITLKIQLCLSPIQTLQSSLNNHPAIYIEGNLYFGQFKNGRRNGFGLQIFPQNQYYYGYFQDDLFHGQGFYFWNKNQYFLGLFENGTKTFGNLVNPKINYTGEFKNSKKMNGIGISKIKTGQIYTGQWKQGKKHGIGQIIQITNDKFIGHWHHGKKSGYGQYFVNDFPQNGFKIKAIWHKNDIISDTIVQYSNGNQYEGPLQQFEKHGKGIYKFKKGGYFKGTFYKDNPTHGQLIYRNGQKYIGSLRNMKRHGFGQYHYLDGTIKKGNWIDDVRVQKDANY